MKKLILISAITTNLLLGNGLESMLLDTHKKTKLDETKKEKIKYYEIKLNKNINTTYSSSLSSPTESGMGNGLGVYNDFNNKANSYYNEQYEKQKESIKTNNKEIIVLKHLEIPKIYIKRGLKEKISVNFEIDKNKNISNINFDEESRHNEINKNIIEAIKKSAIEIQTGEQEKSKVNLHYKFNI